MEKITDIHVAYILKMSAKIFYWIFALFVNILYKVVGIFITCTKMILCATYSSLFYNLMNFKANIHCYHKDTVNLFISKDIHS